MTWTDIGSSGFGISPVGNMTVGVVPNRAVIALGSGGLVPRGAAWNGS